MVTFQDLQDKNISEMLIKIVNDYKSSPMYEDALTGDEYARQQNRTITHYKKLLYTVKGNAVPDNYTANHKCASNFFNRFVTQQASYLLGNGASFGKESTKKRMGKDFDKKLYFAGKSALIHGCAYGFFNFDHLEVFDALEFAPIYDEEDGSLKAGVRFWQIAPDKPLRLTYYSEDGFQHFIVKDGAVEPFSEPHTYKITKAVSKADGEQIVDGENYPFFPIVPLWGNPFHQSEIVGIRAEIDCYDLIKSGFANDLDDASQIYWTIQNAGGMDDVSLAEFIMRMKTVHAAVMDDDGARAESHTIEVPYQSRETYLDRLEKDMYKDFMALDVEHIAGGAITATQILAAYEKMNEKTDEFEYNVIDFVQEILRLNGIDDEVTFTRSVIVNKEEMMTTILAASTHLPDEYVTKKILEILGDADKVNEVLDNIDEDDYSRYKKAKENLADNDEDVTDEQERA